MYVRASLHMRREEKPTKCHCTLYCIYDTLNMFRALLCPSSGALDYMCAIAAYGVQCLAAALHLTPTASSQALHTSGGNSIHIV